MKQDQIFIEQMEVPCRIGISPQERGFPQILLISLTIEMSLAIAGKSDELTDTIDYAQTINEVKSLSSENEFNLVEALAEKIAEGVLKNFRAKSVSVKVEKKVFAGIKSVGVIISRTRSKLKKR